MNNLEIMPGAALDDAREIDSIVSRMTAALDELNTIIVHEIGETGSGKNISFDWAGKLVAEWNNYYTKDIPATMAAMQQSATNLRMAVDNAVSYSQSN